MTQARKSVWAWFEREGFFSVEIQYFIRDIEDFMNEAADASRGSLNHALEALGWGFDIVDETIYKKFLFPHRNKWSFDRPGSFQQ